MAKKVGIEITVDSKGAVTSFKQLGKEGEKATDKINSGTKNATESMSFFNAKTIASTLAIGALAVAVVSITKKFIDLGVESTKQSQKVETQFKTILGSAELAKKRYEELAKFAATTPFQLNGVAKASKILETLTNGTLSTGSGLRLVGDASAIAGVQFEELAVSIGRAYSGLQSNRAVGEPISRLQELGLISGETRNQIEALQAQARGKDAWKILQTELEKSKGGMEDLANTIEGKESTISDNIGLISASFLKASGVSSIYNKVLDETIRVLDDVASRQGIYEAVNAKEVSTLDQAILKRKGLNEQYATLSRVSNIAGEAKRKEIEEIDKLIEKLKVEDETRSKIAQDAKDKEIQSKAQEAQNQIDTALAQLESEADARNAIIDAGLQYEIEQYNIAQQQKLDILNARVDEETRIGIEQENKEQQRKERELDRAKKLSKIKRDAEISSMLDVAEASSRLGKEIFGENKLFTIADIGLSTARGIMSALAMTPPNVPLAGIIGATGLVQAGKASATKLADGTESVTGAGTSRSDSVPALLSVNERVVPARINDQLGGISNDDLPNAINGKGINIVINGDVYDSYKFAKKVANAVRQIDIENIEAEPELA